MHKSWPNFFRLQNVQNYWWVKYLANHTQNAIGKHLIGGFEYCMERNPCYSLNGIHLIWWYRCDSQTAKLKSLPNVPYIRYIHRKVKYGTWTEWEMGIPNCFSLMICQNLIILSLSWSLIISSMDNRVTNNFVKLKTIYSFSPIHPSNLNAITNTYYTIIRYVLCRYQGFSGLVTCFIELRGEQFSRKVKKRTSWI